MQSDLNNNNLLLVTTAVDPRCELSVSPSELQEKVEKLLQMEIKKYSRREARQRDDSPTYQLRKSSKQQPSTNFYSKKVLSFYSFETQEKSAPQEIELQDLTNDEVVAEVKGFLAT